MKLFTVFYLLVHEKETWETKICNSKAKGWTKESVKLMIEKMIIVLTITTVKIGHLYIYIYVYMFMVFTINRDMRKW